MSPEHFAAQNAFSLNSLSPNFITKPNARSEGEIIADLFVLKDTLTPECLEYLPEEVWQLLPELNQPPRFYPEFSQKTFLHETTLTTQWIKDHQAEIGAFLTSHSPETQANSKKLVGLLQAAMVMGDIGKVSSPLAKRFYTELRFNGEISDFLRSGQVSPTLQTEIDAFKTTTTLSKVGARDLPVDLALKLHADFLLHHRSQLVKEHQGFFTRLHTISPKERRFLTSIGLDPATTSMKDMFSFLHVKTGIRYLRGKNFQPSESLLVFAHHLALGIVPISLLPGLKAASADYRAVVAMSEILDKFEARLSRETGTNLDDAFTWASAAIRQNFPTHFPQELNDVKSDWFLSYLNSLLFIGKIIKSEQYSW